MKRDVTLCCLVGFAFVSLSGTLLHYLYDWTGESVLSAPFSGVNESTWEHMKLLFFPLLIFALIQSRFMKEDTNFWCVKLLGTTLGLSLIPVIFYTYNGAFGRSPDWLNIAIFFISAALLCLFEARLFKGVSLRCRCPLIPIALLCLIGVAFVVFTFAPPPFPLFRDPLTGSFGISLHR